MRKSRLAISATYCLLALGPFLLRCAKDDAAPPQSAKPCVLDTTSATVYSAGSETKLDKSGRSTNYAVYWKNGHQVTLTDSSENAHAYAIAVSGTDVYVAGVIAPRAKYWKNGVPVSLTESFSKAVAIAISGSDVYVAGNVLEGERILAVYWKNGNRITLSDSLNNSLATSIAVSGNDVYVSGNVNLGGGSVAKYWLNGQSVNLTDTATADASAASIFISGTDIYVAGTMVIKGSTVPVRRACYWKNGDPVLLSNGIRDADALSIAVAGNKVSVVGFERYTDISNTLATYWHDGYTITLSDNTGKYLSYATATSVFATGESVYVAVQQTDPNENSFVAKYWKDGCSVNFTNSTPIDVSSIFVVK